MKLDLKEWINKIIAFIKGDNGAWTSVNGDYLRKTKRSGIVHIQGQSSGTVTLYGGSWGNLATLPNGYRPSETVNFIVFDRNHLQPLWGQVLTTGVVRVYCDTNQTCNYWEYSASFPVVGGVVRKLLKALKPLTLGRGWAV